MDKQLPAPAGSTGVDVDLLMRKVKRLEGERDDAIQALADEKKKTASMVRAIANLREIFESCPSRVTRDFRRDRSGWCK